MGDLPRPALRGRRSVLIGLGALAAGVVVDAVVPLRAQGARTLTPDPVAFPGPDVLATGEPGTDGAAPADATPEPAASKPAAPAVPPAAARRAPSEADVVAEFSGRQPTEWGLKVAGVVTTSSAGQIALTFDACGGPGGSGCDHRLLDALRHRGVPATLFVNQRWIEANPGLARELAADPLFELANHGTRHLPLSVTGKRAYGIAGTAGVAEVYREIMGNQQALQHLTGQPPRFFRPGTAYYDEVAAALTRRAGLLPVNFSVNADAGATLPPPAVAAALAKAAAGDIVIAHFNRPGSGTAAGFEQALPLMLRQGKSFALLGAVLPEGPAAL